MNAEHSQSESGVRWPGLIHMLEMRQTLIAPREEDDHYENDNFAAYCQRCD